MPNRSLSEGICGCEGGIKDSWCATCLSSEQDMTKLARGKRTIMNHCLDSCTRDSRSRNLSFIDRDPFTGTSKCERLEYARDHHLKPSLMLFLDWVETFTELFHPYCHWCIGWRYSASDAGCGDGRGSAASPIRRVDLLSVLYILTVLFLRTVLCRSSYLVV